MPRSRTRSRSNSNDNNSIKAPPPTPSNPPPPTIINRTSSFGNIVAEGFAWGIGSSIARNIFSSPKQKEENVNVTPQKSENNEKMPTKTIWEQYQTCMENMDSTINCEKILSGSEK